jgi:alkylation response protein AidB-like acyl-CoA dehydrogenase
MDFREDPRAEAFRAEVRSFLDGAITPELEERVYRTGVSYDEGYYAALLERGWFAPGWPAEWGGNEDLEPYQREVLADEQTRVDAPTIARGTTMAIARMILHAGSEEMKREILPKAMRGEIIMVLGFSEPESGSDVAAAQTRAVRDGDQWVIDGQKMFTTNGHIADYVFLLTRTNPDVPKHKGLTMFLVPMKQPGVEAQGVFTLSGERTNITFYNEVRIDDRWRIGDVDHGWQVMTAALQDEHTAGFGPRIGRLVEECEAWAAETVDAEGRRRLDDPDVRQRIARAATEYEVSELVLGRAEWISAQGTVPEAEGPMSKLYSSEALVRAAQDLDDLLGADGLRSFLDPTAPREGRIEHFLRYSLGTTIYAGTSEVQRNIVAQRGLGLPR